MNNKNNNNYNSDESLKRSHSKWSNFKLTLVNLIGILGVSGLWISLALELEAIFIVISSVIVVLYIVLVNMFKR